jgi:AcrR family transcriptional regulator
MTPARHTAEERRHEVVAAAAIEFATFGYSGASTEAIARLSGVSQPYLFQLFGTKKELFLAAVRDCFEKTGRAFEESANSARAAGMDQSCLLEELGHAYVRLLMADPNLLRLQLQAYAACEDPDIRTVVRDNYGVLWETVGRISGADTKALRNWFAQGMLINVVASIGEGSNFDGYLGSMLGGDLRKC